MFISGVPDPGEGEAVGNHGLRRSGLTGPSTSRKLLNSGRQQLSPGNTLGPKSRLKTIESSRIAASRRLADL